MAPSNPIDRDIHYQCRTRRACNTPKDLESYGRLFQTFLNSPAMKA